MVTSGASGTTAGDMLYYAIPISFTRAEFEVGRKCKIHPQQWPHDPIGHAARGQHSRIRYHSFHVLTQAVSMLNLKRLRSFAIDGSEGGKFRTLTRTELMHIFDAF